MLVYCKLIHGEDIYSLHSGEEEAPYTLTTSIVKTNQVFFILQINMELPIERNVSQ